MDYREIYEKVKSFFYFLLFRAYFWLYRGMYEYTFSKIICHFSIYLYNARMYIQVIPYEFTPSLSPLWYGVSSIYTQQIHIGSVVEIPFGTNLIYGIVAGVDTGEISVPYEVKYISAVVCSTPILAPYQIQTIISASHDLLIPIYRFVLLFFQKSLLTYYASRTWEGAVHTVEKDIQKSRISMVRTSRDTDIYTILDRLKQDAVPTVVIFPDDIYTYFATQHTSMRGYTHIPAHPTPKRKYEIYSDIVSRKNTYICGGRTLLWYCLESYTRIIYIEDIFGSTYYSFPHRYSYIDMLLRYMQHGHYDVHIVSTVSSIDTLTRIRRSE
jgi:hypothetical protein